MQAYIFILSLNTHTPSTRWVGSKGQNFFLDVAMLHIKLKGKNKSKIFDHSQSSTFGSGWKVRYLNCTDKYINTTHLILGILVLNAVLSPFHYLKLFWDIPTKLHIFLKAYEVTCKLVNTTYLNIHLYIIVEMGYEYQRNIIAYYTLRNHCSVKSLLIFESILKLYEKTAL